MAVKNAMFLFEVVVEKVNNLVESRFLIIKSDFADVFSLELRDPKTMHIVIPEPPPLPPEPPGKGKKKKPPKPKKPKKGKKGAEELPPPEPAIQSGQSVLFTSNAEFLTQAMRKYPMEVSLWSKEDNLVFIGSTSIPWDPVFLTYLARVYNCEEPPPPTVKDEYNIFEEGSAKIMAKMTLQVKLSYLTDRILSSFRTLSEDPAIRKCLYTGMNSKTTSYMCTLKTTDEEFAANCNKISNQYIKDKPQVAAGAEKQQIFADYKNVPGAKLPLPDDEGFCCMGHSDKPPADKYKGLETAPDIDFICTYVRKIITSCNDNMRMLTPRPTIKPRIKATDIDKLCYCKETNWPQSKLAERFRRETQGGPCPVCIRDAEGKSKGQDRTKLFDIGNIRGPCGKPDCKIARDMRAYLENLLDEDNKEFNVDDIVGPCGSKSCSLVDRIKDFLRHQGIFAHGGFTEDGLPSQCACLKQMQNALVRKGSCDSVCSHDCEDSESTPCGGSVCPYAKKFKPDPNSGEPSTEPPKVYNVYYFTVEYDNQDSPSPKSTSSAPPSKPGSPNSSQPTSGKQTPVSTAPSTSKSNPTSQTTPTKSNVQTTASSGNTTPSRKSSLRKTTFCSNLCPTNVNPEQECSKGVCPTPARRTQSMKEITCVNPTCKTKEEPVRTPSPADSKIVISFKDIHNPCCVKSCSVAEKVKDFIAEGLAKRSKPHSCMDDDKVDPCFCDCECTFKLSNKTTYCAVCGGYECIGDDVRAMADFEKPHPCPVYHKLYNKEYLKTESPWPDDDKAKDKLKDKEKSKEKDKDKEAFDTASSKTAKSQQSSKLPVTTRSTKNLSPEIKALERAKKAMAPKRHKPLTDPNADDDKPKKNHHAKCPFTICPVPKHMGWLWTAKDIPGLEFRPKWKPGAAHKGLVRKYRTVREGVDTILKKKRALLNRKKKIEMKPTLVVKKQDGEYTVQMEVFKKYSKERMLHQYPYDEKPPLIYTIGKTEDTKYKIQRQRERRERREARRKSRLLQSTFRDKCQEICLKAYNQAIGLLPLPNPNNPDCPCDVEAVKAPSPIIDSCSCSQSESISSSDTDNDDWVIEFTPPLARWDAKAKHLPTMVDNESQYSYLDYKVKVLDKQGNQVPRYFKGPDGNQQCSDLGGFYGPNKQWLEINRDGYIGPDNRWVPINFTGPDGLFYLSEDGFFTDHTGATWRIGIDGYVDKDGKWAWYSKKKTNKSMSMITADTKKSGHKPGVKETTDAKISESPKGKGDHKSAPDKKGAVHQTATQKSAVRIQSSKAPEKPRRLSGQMKKDQGKNPVVMNVAVMSRERRNQQQNTIEQIPMEQSKFARYNEIMHDFQVYDRVVEFRPPTKTNRASNTPLGTITPKMSNQSEITRSFQQMANEKSMSPMKRYRYAYKPNTAT